MMDDLPSTDVRGNATAQINLQPIAAPSILGLYGLGGAMFMLAAYMAHWYGNADTPLFLVPFVMLLGGLAQFLAGMWAYKARDGVATAIHGVWGTFFWAYGGLTILMHVLRIPAPIGAWPEMGYWFIVLAAITWVCVGAAAAENAGMVTLLTFLAAGSTTGAIGALAGVDWLMILTGWLFIIASIAAWYTASALMLYEAFGRRIWSLGTTKYSRVMPPVAVGTGEPGVIRGQS